MARKSTKQSAEGPWLLRSEVKRAGKFRRLLTHYSQHAKHTRRHFVMLKRTYARVARDREALEEPRGGLFKPRRTVTYNRWRDVWLQWQPVDPFARWFLWQTLTYLHQPADDAERTLGEQAADVIRTFLLPKASHHRPAKWPARHVRQRFNETYAAVKAFAAQWDADTGCLRDGTTLEQWASSPDRSPALTEVLQECVAGAGDGQRIAWRVAALDATAKELGYTAGTVKKMIKGAPARRVSRR
jgi:hypothetical protein